MNTVIDPPSPPDTMSKAILTPAKLTPAAQSAILSQFPWLPNGKVRVTCTIRTEALLRKAGIDHPKPLESYDLSVRRDESGFLTLNPYHTPPRILENSDDTLFETGGIFASDEPALIDADAILARVAQNRAVALQNSARSEFSALCEIPLTRTFEIPTGPQSKIRVQVIAFEDESLPSPNECEKWKPRKPTDTDVHAAVAALRMSRRLSDLEQL